VKLRAYQNNCVSSVFEGWKESKSLVGRLATGMGKTIIFAEIIKVFGKRALVIAHREELIFQARNKIEIVTDLKFQIEMGDYKAINNFQDDFFNPNNSGEAGVVATVQTLSSGGDGSGRITKFLPTDFDLLIIDEAHRSTAESYKKIIEYFSQNPNLKILGVTATPNRTDEESLGQIFEDVAFDHDMNYGVKEGWLVPFDSQMVHVGELDFSKINIRLGDLSQGQLSSAMEAEKPLYGMADSIISIAGDKRGIGFSPSVNHAKMMADIFNRYRSGCAAHINGKTDKDERRKINEDFAAGKIRWIWNCGTHTEGFDDAGVEVIVPKPTLSGLLLEQMMGRGGRPHDTIAGKLGDMPNAAIRRSMISRSVKPACLLLEYHGNRYDLASSYGVLGGNVSDAAVKEAIAAARKSGRPTRVLTSIDEEEKREQEKKQREIQEAARKAKLIVPASYKTQSFDPFSVLGLTAAKPRGWDEGKQSSDKMKNILRKMGLDPADFNYAQTKQLVGEQLRRWHDGLCSMGQAKLLKKYNCDPNMTFEMARKTIDAIKNNGWKRDGLPPIIGSSKKKIKLPTRQEEDYIPF